MGEDPRPCASVPGCSQGRALELLLKLWTWRTKEKLDVQGWQTREQAFGLDREQGGSEMKRDGRRSYTEELSANLSGLPAS